MEMKKEIRLIDANALLDYFRNEGHESEVIEAVKDAPTVDAVEVANGRCAWCDGGYHTKIMATAIRYHSNGNMDGYEMKVNYCPNCGAKMNGGNEDGK